MVGTFSLYVQMALYRDVVLRYLVHVVGTCCIGTRVFIVGTFYLVYAYL